MKPLGIKVKVALATSATSIVMVGLLTVLELRRMQDDFTKVLFTQQTALINRTAEELDDKLTMLLGIVALSAQQTPPELMATPQQLRAFYRRGAVLSLFDDLLVLDAHGIVAADLPDQGNRVGVDASDRAYFKRVMAEKKPFISEPLIGRVNKQPIVQMVAPILDERGNVTGVLIGVLRLYKDNLLGHLRTAKVGRSGYYFAVTRDATPVYVLYPDARRLLQPRPANANPATTRALSDDFEGTALSISSNGVRALNSYKKLRSVNWLLAASLPADEAFEPFDGVLARLALWSFLASLLAAAVIGTITLRLMAPLVGLRDAILALRHDATRFTPIPVATRDEIGELTMAFNGLMHERLAADLRLQSLIEFAPNAVVVVDDDGRIETFNREAERCFGYARADILGQPLETLVPERLRTRHAAHRKHFAATSLSAEPLRMGADGDSLVGLRRDGSEFPIEINLSAVRTDQGTKALAVISDITERHRLRLELEARAQELERERDRAEAANRAKSDFVANMSHEIRTPMNAVLGMAYLLGTTALTPQQRKYLAMVRVSGQSLMGILNDVLDFSKIEARKLDIVPVDFDLDETMNTLATTMTMNAGEKELELAISVDPDVPRQLRGDALRLQQILVNLAGNAIKFTEQGEVVVKVSVEARDAGNALLRFEVRDTGIGILPQQQAQLFNAFAQGDESITRRFGGTGLGLTITKRLIELMGGRIALDSTPGLGSLFWFSLPFDLLAGPGEERRKPAIGPLRLLVADDNRTSRELIAKLIHAWGWQADEVDSGTAAVRLFRQRQEAEQAYDIVLADWHMAGMDGLATAKEIRLAAAGRKQPIVVMVNAFARNRLEEISSAPEADVVLVKPITSSNLFDALHQALASQDGGLDSRLPDAGIAGSLAGAHFLLVEDNLLNQTVARGILEYAGATLDVVGDGQQAVDLMRGDAGRYDIVLMDMQMPVLDGFSATRMLRQELRLTLPVIAMTAGVLASERKRCVDAGISDFIAKPVEVEEMVAVIRRHLPARVAQAQLVLADAKAVADVAAKAPAHAATDRVDTAQTVSADAASDTAMRPAQPAPADDPAAFNMDSLMRVMGRDDKGRGVMFKMVRGALDSGTQPLIDIELARAEGRLRDAARLLHGLRGAVGALGAKRLIQATIDAESAITEQHEELLPALCETVRQELERTLAAARAWLEREER